jgi:hypothetical protein
MRSLGEAIPGSPPHPGETFPGCRFAPRCHRAFADCVKRPPPLITGSTGREARCLLAHPRCPVAFERCPTDDPKLPQGERAAACWLVPGN